jgi:hypothetical protein
MTWSARLAAAQEGVWLGPASPRGVLAVRTLLAAQALWILLSRPDLPSLVEWPADFWESIDPWLARRYGIIGLPPVIERTLFVLLYASLAATLVGLVPRVSCLASGLLLYHFAPFEEILAGLPHTAFGGLTVPTLGLLILSFAPPIGWRDREPSPEHRWPVVLIQAVFAFTYFSAGLGKLRFAGLDWFTADNIRAWAVVNHPLTDAPGALWLASSPVACWAAALGTLVLELGFPLAVVSRSAARILVPLGAAFHLGIYLTLGYAFLSLPLLLVYVDWGRPSRDATPTTKAKNR